MQRGLLHFSRIIRWVEVAPQNGVIETKETECQNARIKLDNDRMALRYAATYD
jgi:hypothetical protein